MNSLKTVIFVGRSGCGKGTQAKLLIEALNKINPIKKTLYISTGDLLRNFWQGDSYTVKLSKEWNIDGDLQPSFVPIYTWSKFLIDNTSGDEHWIFDGTPRRLNESQILGSALKFFKRDKATVVFINVSDDWATERLIERHRADDTRPHDIEKRQTWFDEDVFPMLEAIKSHHRFIFLEVNGEQAIEDVHKDIVKGLSLET